MSRAAAALIGAVVVVLGLVVGSVGPAAGPASAQPRRVVVVGDSIILGAQTAIAETFGQIGWELVFDADVSRSTAAGAAAVGAHAAELTDTLVVSLGANDAGNTDLFRRRVDDVLAAAGGTRRVLWLTIPEVRPYYAPANQVLRDVAAAHPNVRVVEWHVAATNPGMTASDGLHLTPDGARAMAFLLMGAAVTEDPVLPAAPLPSPEPPPTEPPPPPTEPPPTEPPPTEAPTSVPTTAPPPTTTRSDRARHVDRTAVEAAAVRSERSAGADGPGDAVLRAAVAVLAMAVAGAGALRVARRPGLGHVQES